MKIGQTVAGHASITTMNVYAHALPGHEHIAEPIIGKLTERGIETEKGQIRDSAKGQEKEKAQAQGLSCGFCGGMYGTRTRDLWLDRPAL